MSHLSITIERAQVVKVRINLKFVNIDDNNTVPSLIFGDGGKVLG